ncbi:oligopeptide transporter, OPT family [Sphingomonas piscis]|uniref:Oligopeptide transporter, OPT family n=1 Tax=Sphingomonas piscis TaxID=2714943 RepID=A0A6G7YQY6_9SPHN|nr:oligopeptide transporter, OPT family [Sphingomonas piscis]QIK79151.1 oligopeptide transporter, OPT family [Sphingomonas piscis]
MATTSTAASSSLRELTFRGVILGALLTVLFTAANVYLGLRIGITFATSIPAAVISMALLKAFRDSTIQENNIVQTIASAAGTLSAIVFVLPGLIMVGWWTGFPYWLSVAVIAIGGILGVMYSVPLRRALVTGSDLPYPEGVAAAEVLKVGAGVGGVEENRRGLRAIVVSSIAAAFYFMFAKTRIVAEAAERSFRVGAGATSASVSFSASLIGVGHLVGMSVGIAMIIGLLIARAGLLPWLTASQGIPAGELSDFTGTVFRQQVRFVGAGTIGVAAIWTLLKIIGPILKGISAALAANRKRGAGETLALTERDLPITIVGGTILAAMIPIAFLLTGFAQSGPIAAAGGTTIGLSILYILGAGLVIASVCGYMAGLIGASNSPISGVGILSVLGISLILAALFGSGHSDPNTTKALVAFALFVTAIVFGVATISNDNLQDLKTGQLVGATPWRQQVALVLGVIFGALVIPPILDLLNSAFGFQGAPGAGENALAAPQAALISAIAQGVLGNNLDWNLIGIGAAIGVAVIIADELLRKGSAGRYALPGLAVGMGIYLPMDLTLLIPIGALLGWFYNRWAERQSNPGFAERMGTLMATGLIVGESLMGVLYAGIVAAAERAGSENAGEVLALVEEFPLATPLGIILFTAIILGLYAWTRGQAKDAPATAEPDAEVEATYR